MTVTPERALALSVVFACVRAVSETISTLPLHIYESTTTKGRRNQQIVREHPMYTALHRCPNPYMTKSAFLSGMIAHLELRGNSYAEVCRDDKGGVTLWPLHPERMQCRIVDSQPAYIYTAPNGNEIAFASTDILHFRFMPFDGLHGISPIKYAAQTIALGLSAGKHGAEAFANGSLKRLAFSSESKMSEEQGEAFAKRWREILHRSQVEKTAPVITGGLVQPVELGISPRDAQLLELMGATTEDVCRFYRIPKHKVHDLSDASLRNIEEQNIDWKTDSIAPRVVNLEEEFNRVLFPGGEYYTKINLDGLLRGSYLDRMKAHQIAILTGFMSVDEVRDLENRNPIDGGDTFLYPLNMGVLGKDTNDSVIDGTAETKSRPRIIHMRIDGGDTFLYPLNMGVLGKDTNDSVIDGTAETKSRPRIIHMRNASSRMSVREQWRGTIEEGYARLLKRERSEIESALKRHMGARDVFDFKRWLEEWSKTHPGVVEKILGPSILGMERAFADAAAAEVGQDTPDLLGWMRDFIAGFGERHTGRCLRELENLLVDKGAEEALDSILQRMESWVDGASRLASDRITHSDGAIAREVWRRGGVSKLQWQGGTCDLCKQLSGQIVGIESSFLSAGASLDAPGKTSIHAGCDILHPPLHTGCGCSILPI